MKEFVLVAIAALMIASPALAEEQEDTGRWITPKYDQLKAKWPHDPSGGLIYGKVLLSCGVGPTGFAAECKVKSSTPSNPALEKAALELASLYKAQDPKIPQALLQVDVQYDEPADWARKPTLDDMLATYPHEAGVRGASGGAVVKCVVQTTGLVRGCSILREDQPGLGFGPAALVLSKLFVMKPAMRHGQPVEAEISIPVNFVTEGPIFGHDDKTIRILGNMVWTKTPTVHEILAEIDKKVGDKFADGQVVFQCKFSKKTGELSECIVANTGPGMAQFTGVARSLVSKFKGDPAAVTDIKEDIRVNLAFAFPDMTSPAWDKRYLTHPQWIRTISPDPDKPTFPEQAAKAGLKSGSATVDCVVAPTGALTQCQIIKESTPGMGFGPMAQAIAEVFVANPWDEDGLPVDGAHVRLPIQMDYQPPANTPPAKP